MALRIIRTNDDPILRKKSKKIKKITPRIEELAQDLQETLNEYDGLGIAGPQVGILKRIIVVKNVNSENEEDVETIVAINPEISSSEGEIIQTEACLSFPEQFGKVARPQKVTVTYLDLDNNKIQRDFFDITARCFCHEVDHLNGIVYLDKVIEGTLNKVDEEE